MNEHLLIKKAKKGDVEAFGELYTTVYKKLYRFAFYILKNQQDAEDVVSEAVTDAFTGIRKLKREEAFSNWRILICGIILRKNTMRYGKRSWSYHQKNA